MAVLHGISGARKGTEFELRKPENQIGRIPDNYIVLDDTSVSSHHAVIVRDGEKYTIRDLGSTNGTRVNGHAVTECRLKPKDIVEFGTVELMFDGANVDVSGIERESPRGAARSVVDEEPVAGGAMAVPTIHFTRRRDPGRVWGLWVILLAVAALAAVAWFFYRLVVLG